MALRPPPLKSIPALVCDWIELTVLQSDKPFRLSILQRAWDTNRESEGTDSEGRGKAENDTDAEGLSGQAEDRITEAVCEELGDRAEALGATYPFLLNESGTRVSLKEELNAGAQIYLFCLLLTHVKSGEILDGSWLPAIDNRTRNLFQACSTLAAAGEVEGYAISFGYPRPGENAPFLVRLREVYAMFGEGQVRDAPIPGASPSPKDEEIDVIAWKPSLDGAPGMRYLLGQVASGQNWEGKSIKGVPIQKFHDNWFSIRPASEAEASIFIPQEVLPTKTGNRKEMMHWKVQEFGRVFDRRRLPFYAQKGKDFSDGMTPVQIQGLQELPAILTWVQEQIATLRAVNRA